MAETPVIVRVHTRSGRTVETELDMLPDHDVGAFRGILEDLGDLDYLRLELAAGVTETFVPSAIESVVMITGEAALALAEAAR